MRQILQNLATGEVERAEVPCPHVRPGHVLLRTTRSLISPGTERMLLDFGPSPIPFEQIVEVSRAAIALA